MDLTVGGTLRGGACRPLIVLFFRTVVFSLAPRPRPARMCRQQTPLFVHSVGLPAAPRRRPGRGAVGSLPPACVWVSKGKDFGELESQISRRVAATTSFVFLNAK